MIIFLSYENVMKCIYTLYSLDLSRNWKLLNTDRQIEITSERDAEIWPVSNIMEKANKLEEHPCQKFMQTQHDSIANINKKTNKY